MGEIELYKKCFDNLIVVEGKYNYFLVEVIDFLFFIIFLCLLIQFYIYIGRLVVLLWYFFMGNLEDRVTFKFELEI